MGGKHLWRRLLTVVSVLALLCTSLVPLTVQAEGEIPAADVGYSLSRAERVDASGFPSVSDYAANASSAAFTVGSVEELCAFADLVNAGTTFAGKTVYLTSDLDLSQITNFVPIGYASFASNDWGTAISVAPTNAFQGTFDGQRHTIDNLVIDGANLTGTYKCIGLFGTTNKATVKNLILGAGCSFQGASDTNDYVGGVIGVPYGTTTVYNCFNRATVSEGQYAGGLIGRVIANPTVEYCTNIGTVSNAQYAGGISGASGLGYFLHCRNTAAVTSSGAYAGGIYGHGSDEVKEVVNCRNSGVITATNAGGICGYQQTNPLVFSGCVSYGTQNLIGYSKNAYTPSADNQNIAGVDPSLTQQMLGVAVQYTAGTGVLSESTNLRLISSIDTLDYQKVWFEVTFGAVTGTQLTADKKVQSPDITVVYDAICTKEGKAVTDYHPCEVFSPYSEYFFTFTIDDIPQEYFAMPIRVQVCAMTEGGQTMKGTEIEFRLQEMITGQTSGLVGHETLYDNKYQAWPSVCRDENGVLYAVCSNRLKHIDPFGKNCMYVSRDNGVTWDAGTVINDTPCFDDRDCGIAYLGGGKMVMSYFNHKAENYVMNLNSDGTVKDEYISGSAYWKEWHQWCDWQEISNWGVSEGDEKYDEIAQQIEDTKDYLLSVAAGEKDDLRGSYLRVSNDYGATWGEPIKVDISAPHGPSLMQDGETLLYVGKGSYSSLTNIYAIRYRFTDASGDPMSKADLADPDKSIAGIEKVGTEQELPLPDGMTISQCWEPYGIQLQDGSILAAIRVQPDSSNSLNLQIYTLKGTVGSNGTITWTDPVHLAEEQSGAPAHLLQTSDGSVVVTYGKRTAPTGVFARVSTDGGATWSEEIVLSRPASETDDDLGYPATVELSNENGTVKLLTVFYQHYGEEKTPSIMYTSWNIPAMNP